ncbi:MAG TPA: glycosyltransferase family A protein, partial [Solirubrobacterales bacterium]|nr:glycosyltransferase family A protein [Solirubrobacterales bacterium]
SPSLVGVHSEKESAVQLQAALPGLVSVIVPTFNRLDLLRDLLDSLRSQRWRPLEAIVVDDGSTEDSIASLAGLWEGQNGLDLRILRQDHRGPAAARNRGLDAARGEYLYFIDSDDLVEPDGIALMAEALEASGAPYCVAQVRSVGPDGAPLPDNDGNVSYIDRDAVLGSRWAIHAALYRRGVFDRAGRFDESLRLGEDAELRWRIVAANEPGLALDAIVAVFRRHGTGQVTDHVTPERMGASMLLGIEAFCRWAEPRGIVTAAVARTAGALLAIAAVRLGSAGNWKGKRAALALARRLGANRRSLALRLLASRALESRLLFQALEHASRTARRLLHRIRSRSLARLERAAAAGAE